MEDKFASPAPEWKCFMKGCAKDADTKFFCPTCRTNIYCSNECRLKDWDSKHWKKCKEQAAVTAELFAFITSPKDRKKLYKLFKVDTEKSATPKNVPKDFHLECRNEAMDSPLCVAAELGDAALIELFLRLGSGINYKGANGNTPLHCAAAKGTGAIVKLLVSNGGDITAVNNKGDTPTHVACAHGHQFALLNLLAAKADVQKKNNDGKNPLQVAAAARHFHLVGLLLDHEPAFRQSETILFDVIRSGDADFAQVLIENGMSIEIKSDKGLTPLEEAKAAGLAGLVKFFDEKKEREILSVELKEKHIREEKEAEEKKRKDEEDKKQEEERKKKEEEEKRLEAERLAAEREEAIKREIAEREEANRRFMEKQKQELESLTSNLAQSDDSMRKRTDSASAGDSGIPDPSTPLQQSLNAILEFRTVRRLLAFMVPAHENMSKAQVKDHAVVLQSVKEIATQTAQAVALCKNAIDSTFDDTIMMHCRSVMGNLTHVSANLKDSAKAYMSALDDGARAEALAKSTQHVAELVDIVKTIPQVKQVDVSMDFPPPPDLNF